MDDVYRLFLYIGAGIFSAVVSVLTIAYRRPLLHMIVNYEISKDVFVGKSDYKKPYDHEKSKKKSNSWKL